MNFPSGTTNKRLSRNEAINMENFFDCSNKIINLESRDKQKKMNFYYRNIRVLC